MFRPLTLFIGLRYTRAKRRNHFISFISLASMIGIALGVMVLITVLSVMNGFDYQIKHKIFGMARQVSIGRLGGELDNWQALQKKVEKLPNLLGIAPYVNKQAMLTHAGRVHGVIVTGIDPRQEGKVSDMSSRVLEGKMSALRPGSFGIVIGDQLANSLDLLVGSRVTLLTPMANATPLGVLPRFKPFRVVGIFHVGGGFGFDNGVAFINLHDAQTLFKMGSSVSGLRLKIKNIYDAPKVANGLTMGLSPRYTVDNWTSDFGTLFKAIAMEKTMMFVILLFIIAVAAFNLVSTLVMVVTDKRSDIAILRTMGANSKTILGIFMVQGSVVGLIGTALGVGCGILLALNAPYLVSLLERVLHVHFISSSVYFINYLPSRLEWLDVLHVALMSLGLSFLATLYPAWRASRTQPAEALRYE